MVEPEDKKLIKNHRGTYAVIYRRQNSLEWYTKKVFNTEKEALEFMGKTDGKA